MSRMQMWITIIHNCYHCGRSSHCTDKVLYTLEQPWHICIVPFTLSCMYILVIQSMKPPLQEAVSIMVASLASHSFANRKWLEME